MHVLRVLRVTDLTLEAARTNRIAARRTTIETTTRMFTVVALSLAAIGSLGACNARTVQPQAPGLTQHMTPLDNFGEIMNPKKK